MKKVFFSAVLMVCLVMIMVAADFRRLPGLLEAASQRSCTGYTIVEFDKAIDCHGDTIAIIRKNGFAERATSR